MHGFGTYRAADYDELIDHPVEMGEFTLATFRACGVAHDIAITGRHNADVERLCRDLQDAVRMAHPVFRRACPDGSLRVPGDRTRRGLRRARAPGIHCAAVLPRRLAASPARSRSPTATAPSWACAATNTSTPGTSSASSRRPSYPTILRARTTPRCCGHSRASPATTTTSPWCASGLISQQDYLETLGRSITNLLRSLGPHETDRRGSELGRLDQVLSAGREQPQRAGQLLPEGQPVALCLDLLIRSRTRGRKSLDDLMRALWRRHGQTGSGVPEDGVEKLAEEIARRAPAQRSSTERCAVHRGAAAQAVAGERRPGNAAASCRSPRRQGRQAGQAAAARAGGARRTGRAHRRRPGGRAAHPCAGRRRGAGRRPLAPAMCWSRSEACDAAPAIWTGACPVPAPASAPRCTDSAATSCSSASSCCRAAPVDTCSLAVAGTHAACPATPGTLVGRGVAAHDRR